MSGFMDEIRDRLRQKKFTQEETDILVREVQKRHDNIYGTRNAPPRSEDVKEAWDEVAKTLNATSSTGIRRTAVQCRKRFNDVRRRTKQKITASRRAMQGNGPGGGGAGEGGRGEGGRGASTSDTLSPAEDTTFPEESAHGFGGFEFGLTASQVDAASGPKSEPAWDEMEQAEAEVEAEIEVEAEDCVQPTGRRRRHSQQRAGDLAFLDMQQGGFDMLQRELGALRRTMNTRLRRMESRVYPLLASVEDSLRRLANAAERWAPPLSDTGPASASASAQPTNPCRCLRVRTRGRRGRSINIWL